MLDEKMANGLPENSAEFLEALKADFRKFLYYCWMNLGLPEPTPNQYDMADFLQQADKPRIIIQANRGVGKSWITEMFCPWVWLNDPNKRILVVSASAGRANDFATMVKKAVNQFPVLQYLRPRLDQRSSNVAFDVGPSGIDQMPSLASRGVTGQLTGRRADIVIADDVETATNSLTQSARDFLRDVVKEFTNIVKPIKEGGRIIYLGTPQYEASLYNELVKDRGYERRVWPARYPNPKQMESYEGDLAPRLEQALRDNPSLVGRPTDTHRFGEAELMAKEAEIGKSSFALQYMLDTSLSDAERYPLKISDLIVMPLTVDRAPLEFAWSSDPRHIAEGIPSVGFAGDVWRRPYGVSEDLYVQYTGSVLAIDPSGRGGDETGYAVVKACNGRLFVTAAGGLPGGYDDASLKRLAEIAALHKVNKIVVESNFGDGMFLKVFSPVITRAHPCELEEIRSSKQKERRIIDTLEPVMNQHRLVISEDVAVNDYRGSRKHENQLFWQMTRITLERGCLSRDDRLDALSMGVGYWVDAMARDVDKAAEDTLQDYLDKEFRRWEEDVIGGASRRSAGFEALYEI